MQDFFSKVRLISHPYIIGISSLCSMASIIVFTGFTLRWNGSPGCTDCCTEAWKPLRPLTPTEAATLLSLKAVQSITWMFFGSFDPFGLYNSIPLLGLRRTFV